MTTHVHKADVDLVTVNSSNYYIYRYEGPLNDVENAAILLSWPAESFRNANTLKAFLCTDISLDNSTILQHYIKRWPIETFFQ